jgi:hypothetical protein
VDADVNADADADADADVADRDRLELQVMPWNSPQSKALGLRLQAPRVLIDPVFQDMSQPYRYYLSYCKNTGDFPSSLHPST